MTACCLIALVTGAPVVTTPLGKIQGADGQNWSSQAVYAFKGVPYAQQPIGKLRFADPVDVDAWSEVSVVTHQTMT